MGRTWRRGNDSKWGKGTKKPIKGHPRPGPSPDYNDKDIRKDIDWEYFNKKKKDNPDETK